MRIGAADVMGLHTSGSTTQNCASALCAFAAVVLEKRSASHRGEPVCATMRSALKTILKALVLLLPEQHLVFPDAGKISF